MTPYWMYSCLRVIPLMHVVETSEVSPPPLPLFCRAKKLKILINSQPLLDSYFPKFSLLVGANNGSASFDS